MRLGVWIFTKSTTEHTHKAVLNFVLEVGLASYTTAGRRDSFSGAVLGSDEIRVHVGSREPGVTEEGEEDVGGDVAGVGGDVVGIDKRVRRKGLEGMI